MTENTAIIKIVDEITACRNITLEQLHMLLETDDMQAVDYLRKRASEKAHETYGNQVFIRGLIEFTNYCKNDCLYCGIRHSNTHADRYRLSTEQIMACCESGYELGFRTFVLQGGEDPYYTDERICEIVSGLRQSIRTAQLRSLSVKSQRRATRAILMQGQTDICCAMRLRMKSITIGFIRQRCHLQTESSAFGI